MSGRKENFWLIAGLSVVLLALAPGVQAQPGPASGSRRLQTADSLFAVRQYTQAFDIYLALRQEGAWSPAMLLKMAFIQEGLGHLGESLYYLNLYGQASHDPQAAKKMEELAVKNNLQGYEEDPWEAIALPLREYYAHIAGAAAALALLLIVAMIRQLRPSPWLAALLVLLLAALFTHVQYSRRQHLAIVTTPGTYLMSGPSSASSVVEIIGEGHQLRIQQNQDVWLKVKWRDGEAYVRDFLVRKVEL